RALERYQQLRDGVDLVAQPEPQVGGHLVIARARGMQALAGLAGERGEAFLDVEVDVFGVERPREAARRHLASNLRHALLYGREVAPREDAARGEPAGVVWRRGEKAARAARAGVRERRGNVMLRQPTIERYGSREALDLLVDGL